VIGVDFVSCIELIEHIDIKDHPKLVKSIFGDIRPLAAVITTPNGEFNAHWPTLPHGRFRHEDHRFEWSRDEFKAFANAVIRQYPEYEVALDGIGPHWGGDESRGFCSQAAVFKLKRPRRRYNWNADYKYPQMATYDFLFTVTIDKFDFDRKIYSAVLQALDPVSGIKTLPEVAPMSSAIVFHADANYNHLPGWQLSRFWVWFVGFVWRVQIRRVTRCVRCWSTMRCAPSLKTAKSRPKIWKRV